MGQIRKLIGKRLFLAPQRSEDAPLYAAWLNDQEVAETLTMVSDVITEEGERNYLSNSRNHTYGIVTLDDERLIGNCGFVSFDPLHDTAEVGIFIGEKEYWGKGYGREALSLVLEYGFRALNLHNVMLRCFEYNPRGVKAYKALGFVEIGRRRQAHRYAGAYHDVFYMDLLKEDFRPV